jgi:hypothetical protein
VQRATGGGGDAAPANLDDYNPFDKTKTNPAAVMDPSSQQQPPKYTPSGQQQVTTADFQVSMRISFVLRAVYTCPIQFTNRRTIPCMICIQKVYSFNYPAGMSTI